MAFEETSGMTPSEMAFFENGGQSEPDDVGSTNEEQVTEEVTNDSNAIAQEEQVLDDTKTQEVNQKQEVKQEAKPEKQVPLAALHQARMELKELKEKNAQMEKMFQEWQKQKQEAEAPQIPTLETDPLGHVLTKQQQLEQHLYQLKQEQAAFEQRQAEAAREAQFVRGVQALEAEFAKDHKDYHEATDFLKSQIASDLEMQGATPQEINTAIAEQMRVLVVQAANVGINPAQLVYNIAQAKGFAPKQTQQVNQQVPIDKIAQINKGQLAAKSLSNTQGKVKHELTLNEMASMDDAELEKNWANLRKLMG